MLHASRQLSSSFSNYFQCTFSLCCKNIFSIYYGGHNLSTTTAELVSFEIPVTSDVLFDPHYLQPDSYSFLSLILICIQR